MPTSALTARSAVETVEKACHCEPVLTLARQSASKTYKSCAFRRFLPEKITDSHIALRREASAFGVLLGMTGAGFIDTLNSAKRCHSEPVTVSLAWESVPRTAGTFFALLEPFSAPLRPTDRQRTCSKYFHIFPVAIL